MIFFRAILSRLDKIFPVFGRDRLVRIHKGQRPSLVFSEYKDQSSRFYPAVFQTDQSFLYCESMFDGFSYSPVNIRLFDSEKKTSHTIKAPFCTSRIIGMGTFLMNGNEWSLFFLSGEQYVVARRIAPNELSFGNATDLLDGSISMVSFLENGNRITSFYTRRGKPHLYASPASHDLRIDLLNEQIVYSSRKYKEVYYPNACKGHQGDFISFVESKGHVFRSSILQGVWDGDKINNIRQLASYRNLFFSGIEASYPAFHGKSETLFYTGFGGIHFLFPWTWFHYSKRALRKKNQERAK